MLPSGKFENSFIWDFFEFHSFKFCLNNILIFMSMSTSCLHLPWNRFFYELESYHEFFDILSTLWDVQSEAEFGKIILFIIKNGRRETSCDDRSSGNSWENVPLSLPCFNKKFSNKIAIHKRNSFYFIPENLSCS